MNNANMRRAASLLILTEQAGDLYVLMIERAAQLAFAPSHFAFPGGGVEPVDLHGAQQDDALAHARAALRETHEEIGVHLCLHDGVLAPASQADTSDATAKALQPFARFVPPLHLTHRYLTTFFVAAVGAMFETTPDPAEVASTRWVQPKHALALADAGHLPILLPTRANLLRLARFAHVADLMAHARQWGRVDVDATAPIVAPNPYVGLFD